MSAAGRPGQDPIRRVWPGRTLTARAVLVTCLVAMIAVVITALAALPLAVRSANDERRVVLADKARVAANAIEPRTPAGAQRTDQRAERVAATLRAQGIEVVLIRDGRPDRPGLPARVVNQIARGEPVSQRVSYHGRVMLAEGRPVGGGDGGGDAADRGAGGDGIVLLQPGVGVAARAVVNRLWLALAAGLLAGVVAGALLGRWLALPLRAVATTARRLSAGDRTARVRVAAPAEVADVSAALNELAAALAASENRQRAFLLSVSHELRTPLTTIKGYAEALADGVVGPDGAQRAGQTVLAESARLDRMVADLLALARLEADDFPLELAEVELGTLLAATAEAWGGRCAEVGVVLRTELPHHPVMVRTDPGRVRQVVDGLLENSLRVAPPGAPVVLALRAGDGTGNGGAGTGNGGGNAGTGGAGTGGAGTDEDGRVAVLEVRDGGPGFTDGDLAVVFERGALYQRYRGQRRVGSGLGLALAARLVWRLGGTISACHAPEGGAQFTVRLPR